jgi:hypothetical protein
MFIRIRNDNGFDECNSCAYADSSTCAFCDEADQYEPNEVGSDELEIQARRGRELTFA